MKIIIFVTLCYLLCRYIKSKWKAFLVGIIGYLVVSYIILEISISAGTKLNVTTSTISNFIGKALGEYIVYFILGLSIFTIFNKSKKTNKVIMKRSLTDITNDHPSN